MINYYLYVFLGFSFQLVFVISLYSCFNQNKKFDFKHSDDYLVFMNNHKEVLDKVIMFDNISLISAFNESKPKLIFTGYADCSR